MSEHNTPKELVHMHIKVLNFVFILGPEFVFELLTVLGSDPVSGLGTEDQV